MNSATSLLRSDCHIAVEKYKLNTSPKHNYKLNQNFKTKPNSTMVRPLPRKTWPHQQLKTEYALANDSPKRWGNTASLISRSLQKPHEILITWPRLVWGSALDPNCGLRAGWRLRSADDLAILPQEKVKVQVSPKTWDVRHYAKTETSTTKFSR